MGDVVDLTEYRLRRAARRLGVSAQELAWDVGMLELELREADLMAVEVRRRLSDPMPEAERDRLFKRLADLGELRSRYLAKQRTLLGGRLG